MDLCVVTSSYGIHTIFLIILQSTEKLLDLSDTKKYADVGISSEVVSFCYDFQFGFCYRIKSSSKSDSGLVGCSSLLKDVRR